jgi:hypothetical protein
MRRALKDGIAGALRFAGSITTDDRNRRHYAEAIKRGGTDF